MEKRVIEVLLLIPDVCRIEHQPLKFEYRVEEKSHHYFPDFRVTFTDGRQVLVEAKGAPYIAKFQEKLEAGLRAALLEQGLELYLVPSSKVDKPRAASIELLRSYARRQAPEERLQELRAWVNEQPGAAIADAVNAGFTSELIGVAVGRRLLTVGPSFDLSPEQPLWDAATYEHVLLDDWLGYPGRAENLSPRQTAG